MRVLWQISDEEHRERWAQNWLTSNESKLASALQSVIGYQTSKQTILNVLLTTLIVGIFGSIFSQALFPDSIKGNVTITGAIGAPFAARTIVIIISGFFVVASICVFGWQLKKFSPKVPPSIIAYLDYAALLESYSKEERKRIDSLVSGAGIKNFDQFARRLIDYALGYVEAVPLFGNRLTRLGDSIHVGQGCFVTTLLDLQSVANQYSMQTVQSTLEITVHSSRFDREPDRTYGVGIRFIVRIGKPSNPFADDFINIAIAPLLPWLAKAFSISFETRLPISEYAQILNLMERTNDYLVKRHRKPPSYLMESYPYDGSSNGLMVVLDRTIAARLIGTRSFGSVDPLWEALCKYDVVGSYVTDSENWVPAKAYAKLFGGTSHFDDEVIYVDPQVIVTIGPKSHAYVRSHLRSLGFKTQPKLVGIAKKKAPKNIKSLGKELEVELDTLSPQVVRKRCTDYDPISTSP